MSEHLIVPILILLGAGLVLVVMLLLTVLVLRRASSDLPYEAHDSLLTPAERSFYGVLQQALGPGITIFAKVRLADILKVQQGVSGPRRTATFNRICSKHVDFVLCDSATFGVLAVIELDDKSHREPDRQRRDKFFDVAMAKGAIPVLHVPAQGSYSMVELRSQLASVLAPWDNIPAN